MKKSDDTKKTWKIFVALLIIVLIAVAIMTSGGNTTTVNQIEITPASKLIELNKEQIMNEAYVRSVGHFMI